MADIALVYIRLTLHTGRFAVYHRFVGIEQLKALRVGLDGIDELPGLKITEFLAGNSQRPGMFARPFSGKSDCQTLIGMLEVQDAFMSEEFHLLDRAAWERWLKNMPVGQASPDAADV